MNEYEATIQINPTDDIKFILEESGCYESEIEMMKAGGTYDAFVKRVYDAIDWSHVPALHPVHLVTKVLTSSSVT